MIDAYLDPLACAALPVVPSNFMAVSSCHACHACRA
jgi:hypothetical protein